jgi:hypothetical protein
MPRQEWGGIEPMGEVFLLTFLFIGLVRVADFSSKCKLLDCRPSTRKGSVLLHFNHIATVSTRWRA